MQMISRLATNFGPIIAFFIAYKLFGLVTATFTIIITSIIALIANYFIEGKISPVPIVSAALISILGGITIYTGDSMFIKIKPTIVNIMFSIIIFIGIVLKKDVIRYVFADQITLPDNVWRKLSIFWLVFFLFLAGLNELVWRNFSEETWVNFKVFGAPSVTFLFLLAQLPFIYKHLKNEVSSKVS